MTGTVVFVADGAGGVAVGVVPGGGIEGGVVGAVVAVLLGAGGVGVATAGVGVATGATVGAVVGAAVGGTAVAEAGGGGGGPIGVGTKLGGGGGVAAEAKAWLGLPMTTPKAKRPTVMGIARARVDRFVIQDSSILMALRVAWLLRWYSSRVTQIDLSL